MSAAVSVRRLGPDDAAAYRAIRLAALRDAPEAFGSSYEEEEAQPLGFFTRRLADTAMFGAWREDRVIGTAGLLRERGIKRRHKATLFGVFVVQPARRLGAGRDVVRAALDHADTIVAQVTLTVVCGNDAARTLYESFGFRSYGVEPRSLLVAGRYIDQRLMIRYAGGATPPPL